jgi:hypothetical protein
MKSLKWMVAGTALLIGAGGAIAQPAETPASATPATPATSATPAAKDDPLAPEAGTSAAASPDKAA